MTGKNAVTLWVRGWISAGFLAFTALCAGVLLQQKEPFFDEIAYLAQAETYNSSASFKLWLLNNETGATGPVHALMHYGLSGGKGVLAAPWFRAPNLVLLAGVVVLLRQILKTRHDENPWAKALVALAIPMTWVFAGMALTEMSAMIGLAAALYAATRLDSEDQHSSTMCWIWMVLMAVGVAVAVCGRQTYLIAVPAIPLIAARDRRTFLFSAASAAAGLLPAVWLFVTWGGLIPPKQAFVGNGIVVGHGILALCYVGLTTVLLAPGFLLSRWRIALPVSMLAVIANLVFGVVRFGTMTSVQKLIGYPEITQIFVWAGQQLFVFSGAAFAVTALAEIMQHRERRFAAHAYGVLSLCVACVAITHLFSSRYAGMNLPFLVPMLAPWIRFTPWAILRLVFGMILGAAILYSYYAVH
jgi:hypothetical protein